MVSSFEIISVVVPDQKFFFWIATSVADAAAVDLISIKTLLANGLSAFPIKATPIFSNGPRSLIENSTNCTILDNWVFDDFMLADEPFTKAF